MPSHIRKQLLHAFFLVFRPIVKILLHYGIGCREIIEVMKTAYVDVASAEYGARGRPTNTSRIAAMSCLTRREVKRLRGKLNGDPYELDVKTAPLAAVLDTWHNDHRFLEDNGRPATLPYNGGQQSFIELVRRSGVNIPPGAIRTELLRRRTIEKNEDGELFVLRPELNSTFDPKQLVMALRHNAYALLSTIAHNATSETAQWVQLSACASSVSTSDLPRLKKISLERLTEVGQTLDDLLVACGQLAADEKPGKQAAAVSVGWYYFEEHDDRMSSNWDS